ncbi:hypothetical protein POTOM_057112 [Populus tomentosa]|uniref:G protein gamma domain-containing protein n=1 Tax=Populus tomentosa TaxID=118781 RepID=A0A8X7XVV3_POPTO|nr:hypothetical protein POTOM_057112 [Populus tomentosa]
MAPATTSVPSLPSPCPKSPREYPDLYGKRREMAKVQMLEREIGFLEEELKSIQGLQPASTSCKEVTDFVMANSDPLMPTSRKKRRSSRFWKWLCGGGVALVHLLDPIAVERSRAAGTAAAFVNYLHAQTALVAVGHALVPNVRRCAFVAIVKTLVVIHVYSSSILV